jgi:hypothetical protein
VKVTFNGHFGASTTNIVERWTAGLHLTKNGGVIGGTSELSSFLTNIRTAAIAYHSDSGVGAGVSAYLDSISGAYIGTDGKYALGALQSTTTVALTTSTPGAGSAQNPWSTAGVLTLRSLLTRGPASHGRCYWPAVGQPTTSTTGVVATGTVNGWSATAATFLNAVNAVAATNFGTGTNIGLVSNKLSGFQSPVTKVGIGQKLDSMESRERDIPENHKFTNLTVSTALLEQLDDEFRDAMRDEFPDSDLP